jgi:hypothetical protein
VNWLSLGAALAKLLAAVISFLRDGRVAAAAKAQGRAASDAEHAREAEARAAQMREIAAMPPSRDEIQERLDNGRA